MCSVVEEGARGVFGGGGGRPGCVRWLRRAPWRPSRNHRAEGSGMSAHGQRHVRTCIRGVRGTAPVMVQFRDDDAVEPEAAEELWPVYESVFEDYSDCERWLHSVWDKHTVRDGFRLARAYDDDLLVGFAYGYTGKRGQWWTDNVSALLEPAAAETWLGGHFELVSMGVLRAARRRGIARGLMRSLLHGLPHDRLLLMTTADPGRPSQAALRR